MDREKDRRMKKKGLPAPLYVHLHRIYFRILEVDNNRGTKNKRRIKDDKESNGVVNTMKTRRIII